MESHFKKTKDFYYVYQGLQYNRIENMGHMIISCP